MNAVTYLDMAVRGRPSSSTPEQLVETTADRADLTIPGDEDTRANRVQGLGPLSGTAIGVAVGIGAALAGGALRSRGRKVPAPLAVVLISGAAMALSDLPVSVLGISDPRTWTAKDWAADIVPHLAYGTATYATLRDMR